MSKEAFSEDEPEIAKNRGLKLSRPKAEQQKADAERQKLQDFNNRADQFFETKNENQSRLVDVTKRFMSAMKDKTLYSNKGVVALSFEKEIRADLFGIIKDLDNDESNTVYGEGSEAAIVMFCKLFFDMRDRLNELEYELKLLKSSIEKDKS